MTGGSVSGGSVVSVGVVVSMGGSVVSGIDVLSEGVVASGSFDVVGGSVVSGLLVFSAGSSVFSEVSGGDGFASVAFDVSGSSEVTGGCVSLVWGVDVISVGFLVACLSVACVLSDEEESLELSADSVFVAFKMSVSVLSDIPGEDSSLPGVVKSSVSSIDSGTDTSPMVVLLVVSLMLRSCADAQPLRRRHRTKSNAITLRFIVAHSFLISKSKLLMITIKLYHNHKL